MALTLKQIIWNIKNLRAAGVQSDDTKLSDRQYAFIIDYYRAKLLKQTTNTIKEVNPAWVQNLGKISLVKVEKDECGEIDNCVLYKTAILPTPIDVDGDNLWTYVGPKHTPLAYQRSTLQKVFWDRNAKYTKNLTKWYEQDRKIYVLTQTPIKHVMVKGVFESPMEAHALSCSYEAKPFDPFDFVYPIPASMLDTLYKVMTDAEIKLSMILPQDLQNDGNEEQGQERKSK